MNLNTHISSLKIISAKPTLNGIINLLILLAVIVFPMLNSFSGCKKFSCSQNAPNFSQYFCSHTKPRPSVILLKITTLPAVLPLTIVYTNTPAERAFLFKESELNCTNLSFLGTLTICLPPAEVVLQILVAGIQHYSSIKTWWVQKLLVLKVILPIEHVT